MRFVPPSSVATVAAKALEMRSAQPPSRRGGTAVGLARARQLANREELSSSTIQRMVSFFARHEVDKDAEGFRSGEEGFPSKGRQAWDLWGGDPGKAWANQMLRKIKSEQGVTEMIDVHVLAGANVRRVDGKYGKIVRASMPWVTVEWNDGEQQSYLRSDDALHEDIEVKTLDAGWIALGEVVGINEATSREATSDEGMGDDEEEVCEYCDGEGCDECGVEEASVHEDEDGRMYVEDAEGNRYFLEMDDSEDEEDVCEYCDGDGCEECEVEEDTDADESPLAEALAELRALRSQTLTESTRGRILEAAKKKAAAKKKKAGKKATDAVKKKAGGLAALVKKKKAGAAAEPAKKPAEKKPAAKKGGGGGGKKHSPYKRLSSRGQPPEKASSFTGYSDNFFGVKGLTKMPKTGEWDCKKVAPYHQRCVNKSGEVRDVYIDKAYKKSYNAGYNQATAAGKTNAAGAGGGKKKKG